jgi:hypothetical protein
MHIILVGCSDYELTPSQLLAFTITSLKTTPPSTTQQRVVRSISLQKVALLLPDTEQQPFVPRND